MSKKSKSLGISKCQNENNKRNFSSFLYFKPLVLAIMKFCFTVFSVKKKDQSAGIQLDSSVVTCEIISSLLQPFPHV